MDWGEGGGWFCLIRTWFEWFFWSIFRMLKKKKRLKSIGGWQAVSCCNFGLKKYIWRNISTASARFEQKKIFPFLAKKEALQPKRFWVIQIQKKISLTSGLDGKQPGVAEPTNKTVQLGFSKQGLVEMINILCQSHHNWTGPNSFLRFAILVFYVLFPHLVHKD